MNIYMYIYIRVCCTCMLNKIYQIYHLQIDALSNINNSYVLKLSIIDRWLVL